MGRWSLAIGLAILITCLLLAHVVVGALFANPLGRTPGGELLDLGLGSELASLGDLSIRLVAACSPA